MIKTSLGPLPFFKEAGGEEEEEEAAPASVPAPIQKAVRVMALSHSIYWSGNC